MRITFHTNPTVLDPRKNLGGLGHKKYSPVSPETPAITAKRLFNLGSANEAPSIAQHITPEIKELIGKYVLPVTIYYPTEENAFFSSNTVQINTTRQLLKQIFPHSGKLANLEVINEDVVFRLANQTAEELFTLKNSDPNVSHTWQRQISETLEKFPLYKQVYNDGKATVQSLLQIFGENVFLKNQI